MWLSRILFRLKHNFRSGHMKKCLRPNLGRLAKKNVWLLVMKHRPHCAWSVRYDLKHNIFPSFPPTLSVHSYEQLFTLLPVYQGGFLSAIASIGLLIALGLTPYDGKNQNKRMGEKKSFANFNYCCAVKQSSTLVRTFDMYSTACIYCSTPRCM